MNIRQTLLSASLALALASLAACSATPPQASTAPAAVQQTSAAAAASAAYDFDMDVFHPVVANNGMVATEQELASRIGLDILKAGGNAVDAAVGIGFALAVALPNAGNLGGGGFMMVHDAKTGKSVALDFREVAPLKATRNMYLDDKGNVINGKSLYTHYAVGVPGTVAKSPRVSLSRLNQPPTAAAPTTTSVPSTTFFKATFVSLGFSKPATPGAKAAAPGWRAVLRVRPVLLMLPSVHDRVRAECREVHTSLTSARWIYRRAVAGEP